MSNKKQSNNNSGWFLIIIIALAVWVTVGETKAQEIDKLMGISATKCARASDITFGRSLVFLSNPPNTFETIYMKLRNSVIKKCR